jgi:hypothetical protein
VGSDVKRAVIFAGKPSHPIQHPICYLYLETAKRLTMNNLYRCLELYQYFLCLISGCPTFYGQTVGLSDADALDSVLEKYQAQKSEYDKPNIQHVGMVREYNVIEGLPVIIHLFNNLPDDNRSRAEKALQTFATTEEISHMPNPNKKATLTTALYLSAIDQLADNPKLCEHEIAVCPKCGKKDVRHQQTSHPDEIEKIMRELFTGKHLNDGVKLIKKSYHRVRSSFLHDGLLVGGENEGGWVSDEPKNLQFLEDSVNCMNTCRALLQLYIQKYGRR